MVRLRSNTATESKTAEWMGVARAAGAAMLTLVLRCGSELQAHLLLQRLKTVVASHRRRARRSCEG